MTCYFERVTEGHIVVAIAGLERCSFYDERDDCRTVVVGCSCCGAPFSEELEAAKEKVNEREPFLCLECDPSATVPAFERITMQPGWLSG